MILMTIMAILTVIKMLMRMTITLIENEWSVWDELRRHIFPP